MGSFTSEPNVTRIAPVADINCATCPSVGHVYPMSVFNRRDVSKRREQWKHAPAKSRSDGAVGASISEVREFQRAFPAHPFVSSY